MSERHIYQVAVGYLDDVLCVIAIHNRGSGRCDGCRRPGRGNCCGYAPYPLHDQRLIRLIVV